MNGHRDAAIGAERGQLSATLLDGSLDGIGDLDGASHESRAARIVLEVLQDLVTNVIIRREAITFSLTGVSSWKGCSFVPVRGTLSQERAAADIYRI